jgi:hypothetical protein
LKRDFSNGNKKKKGKRAGEPGTASDSEVAAEEQQPAATQARQPVQQEDLQLDRALFSAFSLGDVKKIQSTPDHQVIAFKLTPAATFQRRHHSRKICNCLVHNCLWS